jgi:transcriptional regulator with XRE-family HTH domain
MFAKMQPIADDTPPKGSANPHGGGDRLRKLRMQLGITAREVEELSQRIAAEHGNNEFLISRGRIIQVENSESTPSIYKLCSLSTIYGVPLNEVLSYFVDLSGLAEHAHRIRPDQTRVIRIEVNEPDRKVAFPISFDPSFNADCTNLLSRVVQAWGEIPVSLIQRLNLRSLQYGMIGLTDYTMYPLMKPGSFVQFDGRQRRVVVAPAENEYNRPIYFIELRDGYLCGWCEMQQNRLIVVPHPLSPCKVRVFDYPAEAEILGRVVAVAARLVPQLVANTERQPCEPARTVAVAGCSRP